MWYQSYGRGTYINLYAESQDSVTWTKPTLGRFMDHGGGVKNNIFLNRQALRAADQGPLRVNQDHNPSVLYTPHLGKGRQYTLLSYDYARSGYGAYDGYYLAFSEDGLHWTDGPEEPAVPGHADVGWFTYDEQDGVFRAIVKNFLNIRGWPRRSVFWTESEDGYDWALPRLAVLQDLQDDEWAEGNDEHYTQFYGMPIFRYGTVLLGFLQDYRCTDGATSGDGPIDVQLVSSRDGRHWNRVGDRSPILARGPEGAWDWGMVVTGNSVVQDGDVVRVYYCGSNALHAGGTLDGQPGSNSIGMATWPRDRLVGLQAGASEGEAVVALHGLSGDLHVNANAADGSLVAEVVVDGQVAPGLDAASCLPMTEDALDHVFRWQAGASPASVGGGPVDVRITLTNAEVFSLWSG